MRTLLLPFLLACGDKVTDTADTGTPPVDSAVPEEDCEDPTTWFYDADGDGYGVDSLTLAACEAPAGYVAVTGDCDDIDPAVSPDGEETCNGVDDDCDGQVDPEGTPGMGTWWPDADGDGYGDATSTSATACEQPSGTVDNDGDCNDAEALAWTGAEEICGDAVDNDCDPTTIVCAAPESGLLTAGGTWQGEGFTELAGYQLSAGDIDGDGIEEVLTSAPLADAGEGRIYILHGPVTTDGLLANAWATVSVPEDTGTNVASGTSAALADLDGDGFADIIDGAVNATEGPGDGAVYLLAGPVSGALTATDFVTLWPPTGTLDLGKYMNAVGDVTGDGLVDVIVEASNGAGPAPVWIVSGLPTASAGIEDVGFGLARDGETGEIGVGLLSDADLTGDGIADLVVTRVADPLGGAPEAWMLAGPVTDGAGLADADASFTGNPSSGFGTSLAAGDLDGDGQADLLVGAPQDDPLGAGLAGGAVYGFHGPASGTRASTSAELTLATLEASALFGGRLEMVDVVTDGAEDVVVGSYRWGSTGAALVWTGPLGTGLALDSSANVVLTGATTGSFGGFALGRSADATGDGAPDLLVGDIQYDLLGAAHVIPGGEPVSPGSRRR